MNNYFLDKYEFKNFLLRQLPDTRQVDLIFWKKTIPMPVDMIYEIFEKRGELLRKYVDHIGAAFIFSYASRKKGGDWKTMLSEQPTKKNLKNLNDLRSLISKHIQASGIWKMLKEIAELLHLNNYDVNESDLVNALTHEGRKYKRLYIPLAIKDIIINYDGDLLKHIALSNGDMFSNVVADELKVYRMGFADAFSGIFNKLIDFIIDLSLKGEKRYANASGMKISPAIKNSSPLPEPFFGSLSDGCLWEPRFYKSAISFTINADHPYFNYVKNKGEGATETLIDSIQFMSEIENETVRDADQNVIYIMRQELSRKMRIKAEEAITRHKKEI